MAFPKPLRLAYVRIASRIFHFVCFRDPGPIDRLDEDVESGLTSIERFVSRFPPDLSVAGKSVLDYGCGSGTTGVWAARNGARRVLGVDIAKVDSHQRFLERKFPDVSGVIELRQITTPADIGDEQFDLVISKNTFEHVSDPYDYVRGMLDHMAPGGQLVIGFSPLWKSPLGGHIDFMTRLPWAHLLFPEEVIMRERRRFRPEEAATRFSEIRGGLNKMTLARFWAVMGDFDLTPEYFETNAGRSARGTHRRAILAAFRVLASRPRLREYFTFSVHSIWRRSIEPTDNDELPTGETVG